MFCFLRTASAVLASGVLLLAASAPAGAEPLTLQRASATPITKTSPCTVEPKNPAYANTTWIPTPRFSWFGNFDLPSTDDVVSDLRAGVNADLCVGFSLPIDAASPSIFTNRPGLDPAQPVNPATHSALGDDMRDIVIDLPRGFSGNLANVDTCTLEEFGADGLDATAPPATRGPAACPETSLVGEAMARMSTTAFNIHTTIGGASVGAEDPAAELPEGDEYGAIWRLPAGPNELGRLGVQLFPADLGAVRPTKFTVRLTLADDGSGRVRATVLDAPRIHHVGGTRQLYVEGVWMRMWGAASDHVSEIWEEAGFNYRAQALKGDFMESPTDCSAGVSAHVALTTYGGPPTDDPATFVPSSSALDSPPVTMTGCDELPFAPSVDVSTSEQRPGVPTGVTVKLGLGQAKVAGRLPALLEDAAVTLPAGLELGAQAGTDGLALCSAAAFAVATPLTPNACPAATEAATVKIVSPLIETPFEGKAYLGEQAAVGELPALYLEASLPGATAPDAPRIKLVGQVTADAQGRITTTFEDNPQLRFSELRLDFPGGKNALFSTPKTCGTHSATSQLRSYAREALVPVSSSLTIDQGCGELPGFAPSVAIAATNPQAGASSPTQITIERPDRSPWLDDIKVSLPSGFLADLHVPTECAAAAAATGNCPASSRIATVSVLSGAGEQPLPLTGQMYLTEREAGAVAGAVIVVRAKIGELDLGDVVVPGRINLRPTDAGLDFITDMPTRFKGLALQLRKVVVDMDREGFALNPSSCGPVGYSAVATGDGGETAAPSGSVAYGGCGNLPFKPNLEARLTGDIKPGGHPGMWVELTKSAGESNLKATTVVLPAGVAADLKNVQSPCARADFDAQRCPAATKVGSVVASVSITPEAIPGDVYLVRVPGETLPGLGLNFTGRFAQQVMSVVKVGKDGRLITRFDAIPDLPLRKLTLQIASGPKGPLQLPPGECAANTRWDATFTGQGGQTSTDETGLRCADKSKVRLSDRGGLTLRNFDFGGRNLKSAKVTLPAGWSFNTKRAKYGKHSWARTTGASTRRKFTRRSLTVTTRGAKASTLRLKVYGTVIAKRTKSRKAKTVSIAVRFTFSDGAVQTQTIRVKAR